MGNERPSTAEQKGSTANILNENIRDSEAIITGPNEHCKKERALGHALSTVQTNIITKTATPDNNSAYLPAAALLCCQCSICRRLP
jgi:hypothetical protein